jgi:pimeloyl-ACP methyl ester carboxylesterase
VRRLAAALVASLLAGGAALGGLALHDRALPPPGAWLAAASLEPRHETVDGRRLRYVRTGSGDPVVLVHGFGSSLYTWKDVLPALAARHEVVALDLPGFGESDRPGDLAFDDLPRAVVGLMDRLGLERVALVGNSLGGAAAAVVAAERTERVSALVLVDAAGFDLAPSGRPRLVRLATSALGPALSALPGKRLLVETALRQVFHDPRRVSAERVAEYAAAARHPGTFAAVRSLGRSLGPRGAGFEAILGRVEAPTLVLWGEHDRWIPAAHADRFVQRIGGSRKVVIPACGHVPQEERPAETARLVLGFLAEAAGRPVSGSGG